MRHAARWTRTALLLALAVTSTGFSVPTRANDLPLAAASPLTGVAFDDKPLLLPVQRNFQMAMLTAGSELGRSCGAMEAYGWRMSQTEQGRVNQIFNATVDRMRMMGYTIEPQTLTSVSNDITLFTADRQDKHFIFLWSAGELGLVMNLCQTSAPIAATYRPSPMVPSVQIFPVPADVISSRLDAPSRLVNTSTEANFTPLGEWAGSYTCEQGYTGGSMKITHMEGKDFEGTFKFYPTPKNSEVPAGEYHINGQYDKATHRILINPGKWISRPPNYYNTVMVGSFDPVRDSFSAFFQGISGCTSFEAKRAGEPYIDSSVVKHKRKPAHKKRRRAHKPMSMGTLTLPPIMDGTAPPLPAPVKAAVAPVTRHPVVLTPLPPGITSSLPAPVTPGKHPAVPLDIKDPGGITLSAPGK